MWMWLLKRAATIAPSKATHSTSTMVKGSPQTRPLSQRLRMTFCVVVLVFFCVCCVVCCLFLFFVLFCCVCCIQVEGDVPSMGDASFSGRRPSAAWRGGL